MTERRQILETSQLLGAMPPEMLEKLRAVSTVRTVARNEVLFRRDDPASEVYGIVSGRVAILTSSPDGRESLVAVLGGGAALFFIAWVVIGNRIRFVLHYQVGL